MIQISRVFVMIVFSFDHKIDDKKCHDSKMTLKVYDNLHVYCGFELGLMMDDYYFFFFLFIEIFFVLKRNYILFSSET